MPSATRSTTGRAVAGWTMAVVAWGLAIGFFWWQSGIWASAALDVAVYREAATELLGGGDVYSGSYTAIGLPFTYPPFALILLVPVAAMPQAVAVGVMFALGAAALTVSVRLCADYARPDVSLPWWGAASGAALIAVVVEPVRVTIGLGQVNLLILVAVLALDAGPRERMRGVGAGIGAAIKITPALLVATQAVRSDWRAFVRGVAAFALCTVLAAAVLPAATARYFGGLLWESDRPGTLAYPGNQSLRGLVERLHPGSGLVWLAIAGVVLATAFVAVRRHRADPWLALTIAAVAGLLVSPVSWTHHWVWVLPVAAVTVRTWGQRLWLAGTGVAVVATTTVLTGPAVGLDYSWLASLWPVAAENAYVVAALAWLCAAVLAAPVRRTARPPRRRTPS